MSAPRKRRLGDTVERMLEVEGRRIVVRATRNRNARRISLRIDARRDCAILTLPRRASLKSGFGFAQEKAEWLARKLGALPPLTPFEDDAVIPFRGEPLLIRHFPLAGPVPVHSTGILHVPGEPASVADRVLDWLRGQALIELTLASEEKAAMVSLPPPKVGIRDPRSRWGSCSAAGRLSFSWRLIMAPPMVLDYVVAHEVAHLRHLNHGAKFKALAQSLTESADAAETWLSKEGSALHRYG
ncbi:MAG TPA: SprT family zinc-dependent metalloprotease [Alphaproteobacteria bacterium]|nr:SprT family zinc-dependent metalloprotease [Alphaproteobacteria bacterium]